jgi:hypothetical protein
LEPFVPVAGLAGGDAGSAVPTGTAAPPWAHAAAPKRTTDRMIRIERGRPVTVTLERVNGVRRRTPLAL